MLITATQIFKKWLVLAALLHATSSSPKNILSTGYSVECTDKTRSSLGCQNIVGCDRPFATNVYAWRRSPWCCLRFSDYWFTERSPLPLKLGQQLEGFNLQRCVVLNASETSIAFLMKIAPAFPKNAIASPNPQMRSHPAIRAANWNLGNLIEKLKGTDSE